MKKQKRKIQHFLIPITVLLLLLIIAIGGNGSVSVRKYEIRSSEIPSGFDGFRIVQLSDLHGAEFGRKNKRLYAAVKRAKPDIIVITGDMLDEETDIEYAYTVTERLTELAPVYYVTGNHEWRVGTRHENEWSSEKVDSLEELFAETGVHFLRGDFDMIERGGERILIAGLDDPNGFADLGTTAGLLYDIRSDYRELFSILLYHRNTALEKIAGSIDLILCGHAHGGLIRFPFIGGLLGPGMELFPDYTNGLYSLGGTDMIVSRGLGNHTGIPRLFNRPHIPVIVLRSE